MKSAISERTEEGEEDNTTMTSATASVLDEMMMQDDNEEDDRRHSSAVHGDAVLHTAQQQQEEHDILNTSTTFSMAPSAPCSPPESHLQTSSSSMHATVNVENVTLDTPSKHFRTSPCTEKKSSSSTSQCSAHNIHIVQRTDTLSSDESALAGHDERAAGSSVVEDALTTTTTHPVDVTPRAAANIPLPPSSPVKAPACALTSPAGMVELVDAQDDLTTLAANVPLPPSPIKQSLLATTSSETHSEDTYVLIDGKAIRKKITAAVKPLPISPAPLRKSRLYITSDDKKSPVQQGTHANTQDDDDDDKAVDEQEALLPFASAEKVDSPVKTTTSAMHALPFSRTCIFPSPTKASNNASAVVENRAVSREAETQEGNHHAAEAQLPFGCEERVDSPVKYTSGPNEKKKTLRDMPFAFEEALPSPIKIRQATERKSEKEDTSKVTNAPVEVEMYVDDSPSANVQLAAPPEAEQNEMDDEMAEDSRITILEAGYPNPVPTPVPSTSLVDGVEEGAEEDSSIQPEQQQQEEESQEQDCTTVDVSASMSDLASTHSSSSEEPSFSDLMSAPGPPMPATSMTATPPRYTSSSILPLTDQPNSATRPVSHAPNTKKRILARNIIDNSNNNASQVSLSTSSSSCGSSSESSTDYNAAKSTSKEEKLESEMEEGESMMLSSIAASGDSSSRATSGTKSLKRKASAVSVSDTSEGQDVNTNLTEEHAPRRVTRQRSLTLLQSAQQQSHVSQAINTKGDEPGEVMATEDADVKEEIEQEITPASRSAPRTRRQSTRLASTSSLPQPSSRIARRSTTTTKASTAGAVRKSTSKQVDQVDEAADDPQNSEAEENVPVATSRRAAASIQAVVQAVKEEEPEASSLPIVRRPQRSARPARNVALDSAKPLPSPGRAVSPVKKPLRATRAINNATALTSRAAKGKGKGKANSEDLDAATEAKFSGRTPLRSPSRVLLSPSKNVKGQVNPMRSPGRAMPYQIPRSPRHLAPTPFDWSSVTSQPQSGPPAPLPQSLSPERYRKVSSAPCAVVRLSVLSCTDLNDSVPDYPIQTASKIFGSSSESSLGQSSASSGPASSAASATGLVPNSSPFKGLAQRLTVSNSPSLLSLSVAPELLVLAPPSPSPTKTNDGTLSASTASTSSAPSMLKISTSSAPDMRRMSTPAQASPLSINATMSPRRALSAQPAGAVPRQELPSPRRVMPAATRAVPALTGVSAATGTPVRAASRVIFAPMAKPQTSTTIKSAPSAIMPDSEPPSVSVASASEEPRRSQRSVRPQRMVKPIMKDIQSTPVASSSKATIAVPKTAKPAVTAAQLQTLTNQNTSANRKLYNQHKVTVIHKDEDRPPSPTSKIRKVSDDLPTKSTKAESAKEGKTARGALVKAAKERQEASTDSVSAGTKRPHFVAAGDEGVFESPVKKSRHAEATLDQAREAAKTLKWDRDLLKASEKMYTPPGNGSTAGSRPPRRPVCKVSRDPGTFLSSKNMANAVCAL